MQLFTLMAPGVLGDNASEVKTSISPLGGPNMPIMQPGHTWSSKIMEAMVLYIHFHLYGITQSQLKGQPGPWTDFAAALQSFLSTLKGGVKKKPYTEEKQEQLAAKKLPCLSSAQDKPYLWLSCKMADTWLGGSLHRCPAAGQALILTFIMSYYSALVLVTLVKLHTRVTRPSTEEQPLFFIPAVANTERTSIPPAMSFSS
eukprot:433069-Amphidinium_carterae.1